MLRSAGLAVVALALLAGCTKKPTPTMVVATEPKRADTGLIPGGGELATGPDLDLLPGDAVCVACVQLGEMRRDSAGFRTFLDLLVKDQSPDSLRREFGVMPDEVERFSVVLSPAGAKEMARPRLGVTTSAMWSTPTKSVNSPPPGRAAVPKPPADEAFEAGPVFVVLTTKPYDRDQILGSLSRGELARFGEKSAGGRGYLAIKHGPAVCFVGERVFVLGVEGGLRYVLESAGKGKPEGVTRLALSHLARQHAVLALKPSELPAEMVRDLTAKQSPPKELLAAREAVLSLKVGPEFQADLRLAFATEAEAQAGEEKAKTYQAMLVGAPLFLKGQLEGRPAVLNLIRQIAQGVNKPGLRREGTVVQLGMRSVVESELAAVVKEIEDQTRDVAPRNHSLNNLRKIALAFHAYHDAYSRMPAQALPAKGKAGLSWRVAILPYLGKEEAALAKEFRPDEPWDSEHNKKLIPKMPKIYAPVRGTTKEPYTTFYQVFTGKNTLYPTWDAVPTVIKITDGTSNTILVAEAGEPVVWTKPDDLVYDSQKPLPQLGGLFDGDFHVAMVDGSVRLVKRKKVSEKTIRAAITPDGGELLGPDW